MKGFRTLLPFLAFLCSAILTVEAFKTSPLQQRNGIGPSSSELYAATLAVSFEEDLALTREIIMDHQKRSTTVSEEQFVQQMEELVKPAETTNSAQTTTGTIDVSVPYDAAARLAYESFEGSSSMSFEAFKIQYLAEAVEYVKSKQPRKSAEEVKKTPPADVSPTVVTEATTTETGVTDTLATPTATETETKPENVLSFSTLRSVVSWFRNKKSSSN
mmetsp:Transcript_58/g.140  ORF Transcript_58/g.140 Transcript_58/m.140 type:complete len:217 (-) Transcript_58:853-1503(-)|eukprot:CAMPEP_0197200298 /NCGR_PEP_ID=MMETSP1423-20130617/34327_1 /TAXON_ID=476441 /ORGANISM="Pseudo-nitzschia heimii, Strain UNC1101" /LENGTH=216 /DNA_ID=CAMNT_0042654177 /DNA_START=64 /DNA_END=714 /DNA_ORIENTATION=-